MNPRIMKKLSKKASIEIERLKLVSSLDRFESDGEGPELGSYKWERKSFEMWGRKRSSYPTVLPGTIGYGCVSGYEEPEWEDIDALTLLHNRVMDLFTEWVEVDDGVIPKNSAPMVIKRSARHMLAFSRTLCPKDFRR